MFRNILLASAVLALSAGSASALSITEVFNASNTDAAENTLIPALLAPGSGITVVGGTATLQGNIFGSDFSQSGTYTGFNLAPSSGSTPTLVLPDGIVLSSGRAGVALSNTVNETSVNTGTAGNAALTALASNATTFDANVLGFSFTVDPGVTSVSAQFVFGTEEFPTQSVTDIFGFFVDGVNYAEFPGGELISNTPGNPTNFISNPVGGGLYDIEYNGLTQVFTVTGILDPQVNVHTILIGIADTTDRRFGSGVFIASLTAGQDGGGGITPSTVPEPATLALFGTGMLGLAFLRRRRR